MKLSCYIVFIFLCLFGCGLCYHANETRVIRGSSVNIFCPFGQATTAFEGAPLRSLDVTAPGRESDFDIRRGHLLIREVKERHSGSIFCSKGREKVFVTRLVVIEDPQHYVPRLTPPRLFLGGPFHLECRLSVKSKKKAFVRFLVDGKASPEGDFTDYRIQSQDPPILVFWFNRSYPVQLSDVGRTLQCEVKVPHGEPCCPRSEKFVIPYPQEDRPSIGKIVLIAIGALMGASLVSAASYIIFRQCQKRNRCTASKKGSDVDEKEAVQLSLEETNQEPNVSNSK